MELLISGLRGEDGARAIGLLAATGSSGFAGARLSGQGGSASSARSDFPAENLLVFIPLRVVAAEFLARRLRRRAAFDRRGPRISF